MASNPTHDEMQKLEDEIIEKRAKLEELRKKADAKQASSIPANIVAAAAFCDDDENNRYALSGVYVEIADAKYEVAATDGRRLVVISGPVGEDAPRVSGTIRHQDIKAAVFASGGNPKTLRGTDDLRLLIEQTDKKLLVSGMRGDALSGQVVATPPEGRFPRYRDVIPKGEPVLKICVDPKLFAESLMLCGRFAEGDCVEMVFRGSTDAITIRPLHPNCEQQETLVVVMPKTDER